MKLQGLFLAAAALCHAALAEVPTPEVQPVMYKDGDFSLLGYISAPDDVPAPGVVIVPDWDNVGQYEQTRATMLAQEFGWVGFAADIYGPGFQPVDDLETKREQATKYRSNNTLFYGRIQAAVDHLKAHPSVISDKIAVIGYCLGGTGVLTYSFLGSSDVTGAVSFHGGLTEFPVEKPINHPVLVLSGGDDDAGTAVEFLESQLNAANATWQITRYSGIEHQFTVWDDDRYNAVADERSWAEMGTFLAEGFGMLEYGTIAPNETDVMEVEYEDDGFSLTGYLAIPPEAEMGETPAVVIVPDWDGVSGPDGYEAHRATMLANEGYIGFAADIYGSNMTQVADFEDRIAQVTLYRTDYELFVSRIQAAVDLLKGHELVDPEKILMIGYCFGGTGVVDYAFADIKDVKAVVPFHGGLTGLAPVQTDEVYPYVLVQSGGIDDAHGNNTELEMSLDAAKADWEISRYSGVDHGFTAWSSGAYDPLADSRSWDAMLSVFDMIVDFVDQEKEDSHNMTESHNMTMGEDAEMMMDMMDEEGEGEEMEEAVERFFGTP